jgi:L-threonylcarbamoyladenylate synthase
VVTKVLKIKRQMPEWGVVRTAAQVIDQGGIICFPTDTLYGLGASIYCEEAITRLRNVKRRGRDEPFVVIVSDIDVARELVCNVTARHRRLINAYWPGPVTIVFEASRTVPGYVSGPDGTIALRIPNDPLAQSILRACGTPLAAPSANVKGGHPALCPEEVLEHFSSKIDLLLDGGPIISLEPSTIVAVRSSRLEILRQGKVSVGRT